MIAESSTAESSTAVTDHAISPNAINKGAITYLHKNQRTIAKPVQAVGLGLHSGKRVTMRLLPALANQGIHFYRVDQTPSVKIPAQATQVGDTRMASVLEKDGIRVSTVEHLMSACAGMGVDNLIVELDNEEVPIMDGSAATFVYLLQEAGICDLAAPKKFMRITKEIEVRETKNGQEKWARLSPYQGFALDFFIEFNHPKINQSSQYAHIDLTTEVYDEEIARARTFGFMHEVEMLRGMGLARGGSLENAIVMDEFDILNDADMRYENEFVRHKILDAIGDLYLAGYPLLAHYHGHKAGHEFNNRLLRAVLADPSQYEIVSL